MIIAMPYLKDEICPHFGKSEYFIVYEVEDKEIKNAEIYQLNGAGHGIRSEFLKQKNVDVLICTGMGMHAKMAMDQIGVKVLAGISGNCEDVLKQFLAGKLIANENAIHACCH